MQKKLDRNYYATLGVQRDTDDATIKKAYKKAVLKRWISKLMN